MSDTEKRVKQALLGEAVKTPATPTPEKLEEILKKANDGDK